MIVYNHLTKKQKSNHGKNSKPNPLLPPLCKKSLRTLTICISVWLASFPAALAKNPQTVLYLKGGATLQGEILKVSSESVSLVTSRGELLIPFKSLEESSQIALANMLVGEKSDAEAISPKEKSKLVSKMLEEREILNQESEGDSPRIRFGRKDFVYRKYTHRESSIDYIFTPVGENQVYDSEETIRLTYNQSIESLAQAIKAVREITATLGKDIQIIPNNPTNQSQTTNPGIDFAGTIEGNDGNPSRVIFGRTFKYNNKFHTLLYTKFGKEKNFEETEAWLGRNFERIQVIMHGLNNLPDEEQLLPEKKLSPSSNPNQNTELSEDPNQ